MSVKGFILQHFLVMMPAGIYAGCKVSQDDMQIALGEIRSRSGRRDMWGELLLKLIPNIF